MERLFFAKIEFWVVVLASVLAIPVIIGFGAAVRHVASGGESAGAFGEIAYRIAAIPTDVRDLLTGEAKTKDFVTASTALALPRDQYRTVSNVEQDGLDRLPIYWAAENLDLPPAAMMFRLSEDGAEHLLILDGARNVVRHFPVAAESLSGRFHSLAGNSSPLMLDDGTIIVFPNGGDGLYRKDLCGRVIWSLPGLYHHSISVADGKLGILGLPKADITEEDRGDRGLEADAQPWNHSEIINIVDVESGRIERSVSLDDIARANAGIRDPFAWALWRDRLNANAVLDEDLVHLNKIELLPQALADSYPTFPAGAWMLSSRHLNLVAVIHPETLEILWHSQGNLIGQHDPEFIGNNQIIAFNNRRFRNPNDSAGPSSFSSIDLYDFADGQWREVYNGVGVKGYTRHSGEVDFTPGGNLLLSLTAQGRYVEVGPNGALLSEFANIRDDAHVYWTKHAQYLSETQLQKVREIRCE